MPFFGWVVKEKSVEHPKGFQVSGKFQTRSGAETMLELLRKEAQKQSEVRKEYFVAELYRD